MNLVTIERTADDGLSGTLWRFFFQDFRSIPPVIYLDECHEWTRPTRQHGKTVKPSYQYYRFVPCGTVWLPPLPDDVVAEAREKLRDGWQHNDHASRVMEARIVAPTQADIDRIREASR